MDNDHAAGLRRDLAAGWPADVVLLFAHDHAEWLAMLPHGTPGRDEAIRSMREFIAEQRTVIAEQRTALEAG